MDFPGLYFEDGVKGTLSWWQSICSVVYAGSLVWGSSCSTLPISILKIISFLCTNKTSWRNYIRRHVCPTRWHWRSHIIFHHGMFPRREMYTKGSNAGYLDLLKKLILDASPANRPYRRKQKPVYGYDTYSPKPVQDFAWFQAVEGTHVM